MATRSATATPCQFSAVAVAGWINRQQHEVIEYLREENRVLRERLGQKRILLDVSQKRRLAKAVARLPRKLLPELGTLFSANTPLKVPLADRPQVRQLRPGQAAPACR